MIDAPQVLTNEHANRVGSHNHNLVRCATRHCLALPFSPQQELCLPCWGRAHRGEEPRPSIDKDRARDTSSAQTRHGRRTGELELLRLKKKREAARKEKGSRHPIASS